MLGRALAAASASALLASGLLVADLREAQADDRIPLEGIVGEAALKEARSGDLRRIIEQVEGALKQRYEAAGKKDAWPWMRAVFMDRVVVEEDGKLLAYPWSWTEDDEVALATPYEVEQDFAPVDPEMRESLNKGAQIIEADGDEAKDARFLIRVIRAGLSGNGNYYPDAVLSEAVAMFEGARVFVKSDQEHLSGAGKDVRNLIGSLSEATFVEGQAPDTGEIRAVLSFIEPGGDVAVKLREAWGRGMAGLFGFSINARATVKRTRSGSRQILEANKFTKVESVDLIVEPGAGGEVISLLEARKDPVMTREQIIALLESKGRLKGVNVEELSDDELGERLAEALQPADADPQPRAAPANGNGNGNGGTPPQGLTIDDVNRAVRLSEARANARHMIAGSNLPASAQPRVLARFEQREDFTEADVREAIQDELDYLAEFVPSGRVAELGGGNGSRVQLIESRREKVDQMLDAFFDPENREITSFKECYVDITGDRRVTGDMRHADQARMREALDSTSFSSVLGDSITRRMVADYRLADQYDAWRRIATTTPIGDFRTNERTRYGGYGDLPAVAESGAYNALASPSDEKATYAVSKRGGTEKVTLEMVKNDDVGVIRRIPTRLARSAKRTLAKFVFDFIKDNPVIYDGVALFHASHNNLGTAALDAASLAAARLAMKNQTEMDSGDRLGIPAKTLLVSSDGEEGAVDLFRRSTNNDKTFIQSMVLDIISVWYWTDANDWSLVADPMDVPTIEIGFLDGMEEPEIFVQDMPNVGSMFTNDEVTYKIKHTYGGTVEDYRGFYKGVVA